jgi:hypothetical protein
MKLKAVGKKAARSSRQRSYAVSNTVLPLEKRMLFAAFTPGDVVVYRTGTGSAALSSASTAVFLDEYTPSGTLVQSIALPTTTSGSNNPLTASGSATSEGELTLSSNGQNLLLTGYDATTGVASIASTNASMTGNISKNTAAGVFTTASTAGITARDPITINNAGITLTPSQTTYYADVLSSTTFSLYTAQTGSTIATPSGTLASTATFTDSNLVPVQREIGIVNSSGGINTSTTLGTAYATSLTANDIRGAASVDGTSTVYAGGPGGIVAQTIGSTAAPTSIDPTQNTRAIEVVNGQLYADSGTGSTAVIGNVGTGLPTSGPLTISQLNGITDSSTSGSGYGGGYEFAFVNQTGGSTPDTLYIADNYNDGVDKYSLVNGSWVLNGEIGAYVAGSNSILTGITGVAAEPVAGGVQLFITTGTLGSNTSTGVLYTAVDPYGYDNVPASAMQAGGLFSPTPALTTLSAAPFGEGYRGVEFVPTVAGAAGVLTQPTSQAAVAGGTVTLFAAGEPGLAQSVQWQVNTGSGFVNLTNGTEADGTTTVSGATTNTLKLTNLITSNYKYQAVFTTLVGSSNVTATSNPATITVTAPPAFQFDSSNTYTVNETAGTETITVDLLNPPSATETVNFAVGATGDTAVAGTNYGRTVSVSSGTVSGDSGTLSFPAGQTTETITIPIIAAAPQNGNKTLTVTLSSPSNGSIVTGAASQAVTIVDQGETFSLSDPTFAASTNQSNGEVSVVRTAAAGFTDSNTVTVPVIFSGAYSGTVNATFAPGQVVAAVSYPVNVAGSFTVSLGTPTGAAGVAAIGSQGTATGTIVATPTAFNLSGGSAAGISVENDEYGDGDVVGDSSGAGNFGYLGYELYTFSPSGSPGVYPIAGTVVNSNGITSLTLGLTTSSYATGGPGQAGNFNVYFINDAATNASGGSKALSYSSASPTGLLSSQYNASAGSGSGYTGAPVLLGTYSFTDVNGTDLSTIALMGNSAIPVPASVEAALVADLNSGASFRLAVTPVATGLGSIQANLSTAASLNIGASETITTAAEIINFNSSSYTVSENVSTGVATITLTRSGSNISDGATVTYTTANQTAMAGVNYTAETGTATFAPNMATTSFNIPITDVTPQNGDKTLSITLSNPATGAQASGGTIGVLGSMSTATLTIADVNDTTYPFQHETISGYASYDDVVQESGPYAGFNPEGTAATGSGGYAGYDVADFNDNIIGPNGPDFITPTGSITAINSISLTVYNKAIGTSGPINVYLVPNTTTSIVPGSSPLTFDNTDYPIEGYDPTGDSNSLGSPSLLGTINWSSSYPVGFVTLSLQGFSTATENTLITDLNTGTQFRIIATPESTGVYADWAQNGTSNGQPEVPQLAFSVQESLPSWLAPNSQAFYNAQSDVLTVDGPSTIIADPGSASPIITANGSAATLVIAPTNGATQIHVGSVALTNGASITVANASTGSTPLILLDAGSINIDQASSLNLGNNYMDVQGSSLSTVTSLIAQGYNSGLWTGNGGINSAYAGADPSHLHALGVLANVDAAGTGPIYTTFDGAPVSQGDVLVRYTYYGDTNLDGKVDGSDYSNIDNSYISENFQNGVPQNPISGWSNGDLNYDGVVDGSDYTLIDNAFNTQGSSLGGASPDAKVASLIAASPAAGRNTAATTALTPNTAVSDSTFSNKKVKASLIDQVMQDLITSK